MKVVEVIESRCWVNKRTGMKASLYGSVPWMSEAGKAEWEIIVVGWTWVNSNGTIGLGRKPAATRDEALKVMDRINAR